MKAKVTVDWEDGSNRKLMVELNDPKEVDKLAKRLSKAIVAPLIGLQPAGTYRNPFSRSK